MLPLCGYKEVAVEELLLEVIVLVGAMGIASKYSECGRGRMDIHIEENSPSSRTTYRTRRRPQNGLLRLSIHWYNIRREIKRW